MTGILNHHSGVRLDMVLGEICVWVTAEAGRRGVTYDKCAASILHLQAMGACNFIATCSQSQRYEFYRAAFEPLEKFCKRKTPPV